VTRCQRSFRDTFSSRHRPLQDLVTPPCDVTNPEILDQSKSEGNYGVRAVHDNDNFSDIEREY
jgi:hypothetical protein